MSDRGVLSVLTTAVVCCVAATVAIAVAIFLPRAHHFWPKAATSHGEYTYVDFDGSCKGEQKVGSGTDRIWYGPDETPLTTRVSAHATSASKATIGKVVIGNTTITAQQLRSLPTETDALAAKLRGYVIPAVTLGFLHPSATVQIFSMVGDLALLPVGPQLRLAAIKVVEGLPGVITTSNHTDKYGHVGVQLKYLDAIGNNLVSNFNATTGYLQSNAVTIVPAVGTPPIVCSGQVTGIGAAATPSS